MLILEELCIPTLIYTNFIKEKAQVLLFYCNFSFRFVLTLES